MAQVTASPLLGRSKEAGCKIVVLDKSKNTTRTGSRNELFFSFLFESKTTDAAVAKIREYTDKPWDVVRMAVQRGFISLVPQDGKAAAKPAKASAPATAKKVVKPRTAGRRAVDKAVQKVVKVAQAEQVL